MAFKIFALKIGHLSNTASLLSIHVSLVWKMVSVNPKHADSLYLKLLFYLLFYLIIWQLMKYKSFAIIEQQRNAIRFLIRIAANFIKRE